MSKTLINPSEIDTSESFDQVIVNSIDITPDEGTFTPNITFATAGDLSVTYFTQTARYLKIGNLVTITMQLDFTPTFTTASGNFRIANLPFAINGTTGLALSGGLTLPSYAGGSEIAPRAINNQTYLQLHTMGSGITSAALTATNFTSGVRTALYISGSYFV